MEFSEFSLEVPLLPCFSSYNLYTVQLYKVIPEELSVEAMVQGAQLSSEFVDIFGGKKMKGKMKQVFFNVLDYCVNHMAIKKQK